MIEALTGWTVLLIMFAIATVVVIAAVYLLMTGMAKPQIRILSQDLVGKTGVALTAISHREGKIEIDGAKVIAIADEPIERGRAVKVLRVEGVVAKVGPAQAG